MRMAQDATTTSEGSGLLRGRTIRGRWSRTSEESWLQRGADTPTPLSANTASIDDARRVE